MKTFTKEELKRLKSKLLAGVAAAAVMGASTPVAASAENISAQEIMDQLINGKQVSLNEDEVAIYIDPIKQAVIKNGANLLPEDVEKLYNSLKQGTSKSREEDAVALAMSVDYLLDTNLCSSYPQALQIENVTNYTCNELQLEGYEVVPSFYRSQMTGEENYIELEEIVKKAKSNREIKEVSYIVINAVDRGYYDDKCYNIPDDNPATGIEFNDVYPMIASIATMALTFKGKKKEQEEPKVKTIKK